MSAARDALRAVLGLEALEQIRRGELAVRVAAEQLPAIADDQRNGPGSIVWIGRAHV